MPCPPQLPNTCTSSESQLFSHKVKAFTWPPPRRIKVKERNSLTPCDQPVATQNQDLGFQTPCQLLLYWQLASRKDPPRTSKKYYNWPELIIKFCRPLKTLSAYTSALSPALSMRHFCSSFLPYFELLLHLHLMVLRESETQVVPTTASVLSSILRPPTMQRGYTNCWKVLSPCSVSPLVKPHLILIALGPLCYSRHQTVWAVELTCILYKLLQEGERGGAMTWVLLTVCVSNAISPAFTR